MLCESSAWQATLGKRFLGIYVTDYKGQRIGILRSAGRLLAKQGSGWFGVAIISLVTILAAEKQQGLHNFAAKTLVARGPPTPNGDLDLWRIGLFLGIPITWMLGTFLATM